jgi:hypothetical protein
MLNRYRRHNAEVKEFFRKNVPGKLLVHDAAAGDGWPKLCAFLDRPVPVGIEYPKKTSDDGAHS